MILIYISVVSFFSKIKLLRCHPLDLSLARKKLTSCQQIINNDSRYRELNSLAINKLQILSDGKKGAFYERTNQN